MAQHGGKRPGAGRKTGDKNRATAEAKMALSDLAKQIAPEALQVAAKIMRDETQTGPARMTAVNTILDRAYGRAPQAVTLTGPSDGPVQIIDPSKISTDALREIMGAINAHPDADEG